MPEMAIVRMFVPRHVVSALPRPPEQFVEGFVWQSRTTIDTSRANPGDTFLFADSKHAVRRAERHGRIVATTAVTYEQLRRRILWIRQADPR
jgi:hypothetical protein